MGKFLILNVVNFCRQRDHFKPLMSNRQTVKSILDSIPTVIHDESWSSTKAASYNHTLITTSYWWEKYCWTIFSTNDISLWVFTWFIVSTAFKNQFFEDSSIGNLWKIQRKLHCIFCNVVKTNFNYSKWGNWLILVVEQHFLTLLQTFNDLDPP